MPNFLRQLIDLCLFQAKPQDLPSAPRLLIGTALFATAAYAVTDPTFQQASHTLGMAIGQVALFGVAIWIVLRLRGFPERFVQTATALYGTGGLIQLLGWPIFAWMHSVDETPAAGIPFMLVLLLSVWFLAIMTMVLRNALETSVGMSLLITIATQGAVGLLLLTLFAPAPAGT